MSGAARRSEVPVDELFPPSEQASLKQAAAERLAAHRERRASERANAEASAQVARQRAEQARTASRRGNDTVRQAVAARYQQSQSYREFLAAEAERALEQAQAEAEMAARKAEAVAEAQAQLLADLQRWEQPSESKAEIRSELAHELADIALGARELMAEPPLLTVIEPPRPAAVRGLTVRLHEDLEPAKQALASPRVQFDQDAHDEIAELEQEIEFRRAPEFQQHNIAHEAIPANIIQFPRQLIAPRKARPRLAEGPLIEEAPLEPQLRIFEVEANQIAIEPEQVFESVSGAPEWQSLLLESTAVVRDVAPAEAQSNLTFTPQAAPVSLRLMAASVDGVCVVAGWLAFCTVVAEMCGPKLLLLKPAMIAGSAVAPLVLFFFAFQALCFSFSDSTPGMRYARIALCTFADGNPSRKSMRFRMLATVLAACPLFLGFAWMWMDDDRLGWHDRISRMYQRSY